MIKCKKCGSELAENWLVCPFCGRPANNYTPTSKKRGNGQGTVLKTASGKYKAIVTLGYYLDDDGKRHRKVRTKVYSKKSDAVGALAALKQEEEKKAVTFQQLYNKWLPTHRAGKDTINCYKAAYKHFKPLYPLQISGIDIDDLQECLDDCPHGKRTRQNMKTMLGLMYKYGIPRDYVPNRLNLADYLKVDGDAAAHRSSFNDIQLETIKKACGKVPHAELIYILCYLGFRPSEFLDLTVADYDKEKGIIVGGAKTEAGKGRVVPVSPKIKPWLDKIVPESGYLIPLDKRVDRLKVFTNEIFYPTLEAIGIENPMVEIAGGKMRHKYTPHSCRHTFATLMKKVAGADKDKQELIGHASAEMLRYYQDTDLPELRAIIEAI